MEPSVTWTTINAMLTSLTITLISIPTAVKGIMMVVGVTKEWQDYEILRKLQRRKPPGPFICWIPTVTEN